jgi:hypothetical protein
LVLHQTTHITHMLQLSAVLNNMRQQTEERRERKKYLKANERQRCGTSDVNNVLYSF